MPWGMIFENQGVALREHVTGRRVHDLGAGTMQLSEQLLDLGAESIVAVDKLKAVPHPLAPRIESVQAYFHEYRDLIDVAFVSWPQNFSDHGLIRLCERARVVCYLGKCTDGEMCGSPALFDSFLKREVLAHVPQRANTLIVYGKHHSTVREPFQEELGGLDHDRVYGYASP